MNVCVMYQTLIRAVVPQSSRPVCLHSLVGLEEESSSIVLQKEKVLLFFFISHYQICRVFVMTMGNNLENFPSLRTEQSNCSYFTCLK